jgi:hypothetical protein
MIRPAIASGVPQVHHSKMIFLQRRYAARNIIACWPLSTLNGLMMFSWAMAAY